MRIESIFERIDAELSANDAEREANPGDPSVQVLVDLDKLPPEALEWVKRR